jgi:lipopolysaccharide export LptBFGC system permease protein LptF
MAALTPLDGGQIKQSRASLVGGIAVAIGVFVLWAAIAQELQADGALPLLAGAVVSALVGLWIWRADL